MVVLTDYLPQLWSSCAVRNIKFINAINLTFLFLFQVVIDLSILQDLIPS